MKLTKYFVLFLLLQLSCFTMSAESPVIPPTAKEIPLSVVKTNVAPSNDDRDNYGNEKRAPMRFAFVCPELSIEGHTLYFNEDCFGCVVEFVQNGNMICKDAFSSSGKYDIPVNFSGVVVVYLYVGGWKYSGEITLF